MPIPRRPGPLTESEKKWRQALIRKVESLSGKEAFQTAFLDPLQLEIAAALLRDYPHLSTTVFGGYSGAERVRLRVSPAAQQGILPEVACLMVSGPAGDARLSHRDFLGSVLGLGLRRDQVGDIVLLPDGKAIIMLDQSKAAFICAQLVQVANLPVECFTVDAANLPLPAEEGKAISGTVASMRLDAVLAIGFGLSRSRVVLLIKGGLVKVNWRFVDSPAFHLQEGDLVSLQGRGRLEIEAVTGETRKGRMRLALKKYS
ncbi:MAG: YlmH/Sll1252 family protein [Bacillota bacterium]